jgi:hypothetical protein
MSPFSPGHFNPAVAALKLGRYLDSLERLKLCDTFRYFVHRVLGAMPRGWKP